MYGIVDYPEFVSIADAFAANDASIALEGGAGMGKTSMIEAYAALKGLPCITVAVGVWNDPACITDFGFGVQMKEGHISGINSEDKVPAWAPVWRIDPKTGKQVKTTKETMGLPVYLDESGRPVFHAAIVFFDEFSAPRAELQNAILTLCLTKRLKNWNMDKETRFFVAYNSANRAEFSGFVNEISPALVGSNGRFVNLKVRYNAGTILDYVNHSQKVSNFWKVFTSKNLRVLDIYNEEKGRKMSPRSYVECLKALSTAKIDNTNFGKLAENILFAFTGEDNTSIFDAFIEKVNTFVTFNAEDILSGKQTILTQIDANLAVAEILNVFQNRRAQKKALLSAKEKKNFETFVTKQYVTGFKNEDGTDKIASKKEFLEVIKAALIEADLMHYSDFSFIAEMKDEKETKKNEETFDF